MEKQTNHERAAKTHDDAEAAIRAANRLVYAAEATRRRAHARRAEANDAARRATKAEAIADAAEARVADANATPYRDVSAATDAAHRAAAEAYDPGSVYGK